MFKKFKKVIAGILIGLGIGILLILCLPINAWLVIISLGLILIGVKYLFKC